MVWFRESKYPVLEVDCSHAAPEDVKPTPSPTEMGSRPVGPVAGGGDGREETT